MKKSKIVVLSALAFSLPALSACDIAREALGGAKPNRAPVVASLDYSPKSSIKKDDVITFTLVATDPEGQPLQYNWTATKGTLSGNTGTTISWKPVKSDGSFETGFSTVSVIVSDTQMTTTANVNIFVSDKEDKVEIKPTPTASPTASATATPSATPTPSPTATATPSAAPTATPSPTAVPTATPTPVPTATATATVTTELSN